MNQEIHFVTGKGGVGKSAYAAAFAMALAKSGKKTLLVELGDYSFYKDYLGLADIKFNPVAWIDGVDVCLWRGEDCLYEYAHYLIKIESLVKLFFNNSVMKTFIQIAPALPELAIMGKITSQHRQHGPQLLYDAIVVDSYASGHFKALIKAAQAMYESFQFGPMALQSQGIDRVLKNKDICHFHIVTLPEELPIKEATELTQDIQQILNQEAHVIVNKCISLLASDDINSAIDSNEKKPSHESSFISYLSDHFKKELDAVQICRQSSDHVRQLPLVLSNDPHVVVDQLHKVVL